eukprot:gnl/Chilomastix_caulleri/8544.p2 GENE.gnl/Chilomastix_caulleri/8544~~gnl/Chilomastix_caulleri/8544.p2  ORF type:complete len:129 (+),score=8.25 gnl/Chilomastix_caulleri/8544:397-783(+)
MTNLMRTRREYIICLSLYEAKTKDAKTENESIILLLFVIPNSSLIVQLIIPLKLIPFKGLTMSNINSDLVTRLKFPLEKSFERILKLSETVEIPIVLWPLLLRLPLFSNNSKFEQTTSSLVVLINSSR